MWVMEAPERMECWVAANGPTEETQLLRPHQKGEAAHLAGFGGSVCMDVSLKLGVGINHKQITSE